MRVSGLWFGVLTASVALAQPDLYVWHGASWVTAGESGGLAPGSIFTVQILLSDPPACLNAAQLTIRVEASNGTAIEFPAELSERPCIEIRGTLPPRTPLGAAKLSISGDGKTRARVPVTILRSSFGIFTRSGTGRGAALGQHGGELIQLSNPARPGEVITLSGTGLGNNIPLSQVSLELAGKAVALQYAGPAAEAPGLDQISFTLPEGEPLSTGCYTTIVVQVGDRTSEVVTIAMAPKTGGCVHPLGLGESDLQRLDSGGKVTTAAVKMRVDSQEATLRVSSALDVELLAETSPRDPVPRCRVGDTAPPNAVLVPLGPIELPDAGERLLLRGPGDRIIEMPSTQGAYRSATGPPLDPGAWTLSGVGGAAVAAFEAAAVTLPRPVRWTNREALRVVNRQQDQAIEWETEGFAESDLVQATISAPTDTWRAIWSLPFASVDCFASALDGKLVMPAALLARLPALTEPRASFTVAAIPDPARRVIFPLPLTAGGAGVGVIDYQLGETAPVQIE